MNDEKYMAFDFDTRSTHIDNNSCDNNNCDDDYTAAAVTTDGAGGIMNIPPIPAHKTVTMHIPWHENYEPNVYACDWFESKGIVVNAAYNYRRREIDIDVTNNALCPAGCLIWYLAVPESITELALHGFWKQGGDE